MSTFLTNKEIILEIREAQKKDAEKLLNMSLDMSNFMNKQATFNENISLVLKKIQENEENNCDRISKLEVNNKIFNGKITVLGVVFSVIGGAIGYIVNLIYK